MLGLSVLERVDDQKRISPPTDLRINGQDQRWKVLHQTGYSMGLQQRRNQRRGQMESRVQNQLRVV